jgi:hypothetical protein
MFVGRDIVLIKHVDHQKSVWFIPTKYIYILTQTAKANAQQGHYKGDFSAIWSFLHKAPFSYKSKSWAYLPMLKILENSKIQGTK